MRFLWGKFRTIDKVTRKFLDVNSKKNAAIIKYRIHKSFQITYL